MAQKLVDTMLIEHLQWQTALGHPTREMSDARNVTLGCSSRISAILKVSGICVHVWRKYAIAQPCLGRWVKCGDWVHDDLRWCGIASSIER
jgi:hypothetical protein